MGHAQPHPDALAQDLNLLYLTGQEVQLPAWMAATIIEVDDEDLQFGGKALSAWHEEDRRRYSLESSCPGSPSSPSSEAGSSEAEEEERERAVAFREEERRGRQRDRPEYRRHHHHGHRKAKEEKRQ